MISRNRLMGILLTLLIIPLELFAVAGAGVLPYAFNPKDKKMYFLFSREAFGQHKGSWADFGGKANAFERNNPKRVAARECAEESIKLFGNRLKIENYLAKNQSGIFTIQRKYAMYLVPVAYDPTIGKHFAKARRMTTQKENKEKDKLIWVKATDIVRALRNNRDRLHVHNQSIQLRKPLFELLARHGQSIIKQIAKQKTSPKRLLKGK
jgi:hypothetical protein